MNPAKTASMTERALVAPPRNTAPKAATSLANELRRRIVSGDLVDGDVLPTEAALVAQFDVARATVREALRVLESESLITVRRGRHGGAAVRTPDVAFAKRYVGIVLEHSGASIADVCEARTAIELHCLSLLSRSEQKLDALAAAADEPLRDDYEARLNQHEHYHELVVELSGNTTLSLLHGVLRSIVGSARLRKAAPDPDLLEDHLSKPASGKAHRRLVRLLRAGDSESAVRFWREHLLTIDAFVVGSNLVLPVRELD